MNNIVDYIKENTKDCSDVFFRDILIEEEKFNLIFSEVMTDSNTISNFVIRSLTEIVVKSKEKEEIKEEADLTLREKIENKLTNQEKINIEGTIAINKIKKIDIETENVFKYIFSGFVIIIYHNDVYCVETRANLYRSISEPVNEISINGAKDSFVESIMRNVGLLRNRIKTEKLVFTEMEIGRKTSTKVGLMYVSDIARKELVDYIQDKLNKIDIDGILDSNYIEELIIEPNDSDFPTVISSQRPDIASYYLLQGKIVILVDNSPFVLIVPAFFGDFINNVDDLYQKASNVTLTKIMRYIALIISIITPAMYISLMTFDQESIPTILLRSFAIQREGVPFPTFFEAIMMITAFEILRESDMRSRNLAGNTLSIVGALILGDAAVNAGIVSPIMIIVIAITTISGLMFSDINMLNALRKWRFIYLILASIFSLPGIGIATTFMIVSMASTSTFTKSLTYPVAPFNLLEVKKNLFSRSSINKNKSRQEILTDNLTKSR